MKCCGGSLRRDMQMKHKIADGRCSPTEHRIAFVYFHLLDVVLNTDKQWFDSARQKNQNNNTNINSNNTSKCIRLEILFEKRLNHKTKTKQNEMEYAFYFDIAAGVKSDSFFPYIYFDAVMVVWNFDILLSSFLCLPHFSTVY